MELKCFKRKIKELGYKFKTYTYNSSNLRFLEILDQEKNFICGSGSNCYFKDHIIKHKEIFDLLNKYRDKVFDNQTKIIF